jgi:hypothetical protein
MNDWTWAKKKWFADNSLLFSWKIERNELETPVAIRGRFVAIMAQ